MDEIRKRLVRLALTLAEAKGKWGDREHLYSTDREEIRDMLMEVAHEIETIVIGDRAAKPALADADDSNLNFDLYKPALRVAE